MFLTFKISFHLERSNLSHHARLKYHPALSLQVRLHPVHSTPFKIYAALSFGITYKPRFHYHLNGASLISLLVDKSIPPVGALPCIFHAIVSPSQARRNHRGAVVSALRHGGTGEGAGALAATFCGATVDKLTSLPETTAGQLCTLARSRARSILLFIS